MVLRVGAVHDKSAPFLYGVHRSSARGNIVYLICHVTSQGNFIEGLYKFIIGSCSW